MSSQPRVSQIRVLVVDDSAFMRTALSRMIGLDPDLRVVGAVASGAEALQTIVSLDPDVITLDVEMPGLDGVETLRRIMAQFPRPVIMVSATTLKGAEITFNALAAGAFDYVPKQLCSTSLDILHIRDGLIAKIKAAAELRHAKDHLELPRKPPRAEAPRRTAAAPSSAASIVVLGISTGGPKALHEILPHLPADLPVPILIVLHMPAGFTAPFAERLNNLCAVAIREASHGEVARPGVVYFAPAGLHMTVDRPTDSRTVICLAKKPENQLHIPSVDVLMGSVASAFHSQAMGVIMTGMGSDGAQGMNAIHRQGGFTVGQDEASCAVYGMPRVCAEMGILDKVVPLTQIPNEILQAARYRKTSVS
ncbi:MAG TPA: chemotaxis response regulator protein-glutamate methylesterase [Candidatus Dormibacteraeota bacterium]|nr:chemotaxis response regulator protein-glutamate methylesterase [Candidatus Dormibacteraeota bacterium]